ncbi:tRNA lysidine(34) synthetase TilS [Actinopolymorpha pittospori]|uniref:tRNA(Ile)-lysidine synthase n=1 Tax=Actinopolymorpha pittospori TaxID=648752 RepID=A0A927R9Q6_9ACTN|nr:tRNA lysidine(34) synthetase TilS [Actinopolymorpha pittospori]MBE1606754.1 tRNA(Ile)-lysidine synthase [Actinopolymorpha pittospori]
MGPHPAVAAVRVAVRRSVADLAPGSWILVACSGGADSTALAAATAFEAPRAGFQAGAVTVDHGLQPGSDERARAVADVLRGLGLRPVEAVRVDVTGGGGPEAAARRARYAALDEAADRLGACAVLLGHTRDDQAETVLLGLARGSGARSLAGMPPRSVRGGRYRRPLLALTRSTTEAACEAEGLRPWADPHNSDPSYARSRVRQQVLPLLERELGPGVAAALARTADLLRDDADALDAWADRAYAECVLGQVLEGRDDEGRDDEGRDDEGRDDEGRDNEGREAPGHAGQEAGAGHGPTGRAATDGDGASPALGLAVDRLEALPAGVRRRVLRRAALAAGCPGTDLFAVHVAALESLVTQWHGQAWVDLPGSVRVTRRDGQLRLRRV